MTQRVFCANLLVMNLEKLIADEIGVEESMIQESPKPEMGDFSFPCFALSKKLKKSPAEIMNELKQKINDPDLIEKVEEMGSYLNFFLNKQKVGQQIMKEFSNFKFENLGENKVVCVDYCSVNLAKYLHIGHFATTIIGESLCRLYESFGYKVVRINYVGDFGLPFGKMVVAYKLWGNKEEVEKRGIDAIQDLYVKFNREETEELLNEAREASAKIERGEGEEYDLYRWIVDITINETKNIVGRLGIQFDDWRGESTYNGKMDAKVEEIKKAGLSQIGERGATIIDLNDYGLGVCVLKRSDDASLYITRDLCAVEDRYELYHFDKMLYVTAVQQNSHFAKLIKICELLDKPYTEGLVHVNYGMFSLPEGKIASRKGKQAVFVDILNEAEERAGEVIAERKMDENVKTDVTKKVAMGAIAYSTLKVERIKDKVFDMDKAISFDGETGPYLQYTYARCCSLIRKFEQRYKEDVNAVPEINYDVFEMLKIFANYDYITKKALDENEPSVIAKQVMYLAKLFNKFYNEHTIITDNENESAANINLVKQVRFAIGTWLKLLCVEPIEVM